MWQKPWGFKESLAICIGLFFIGLILQTSVGQIYMGILVYPYNIIIGIIYIILLLSIDLLFQKSYIINWLRGYHAAIGSLISMVSITLIMGFTRQFPDTVTLSGLPAYLGFSQMLSSWPFSLLLLWFLTILGMVSVHSLRKFRWNRIPFLLNHLGLFIAIFGAILGNGDMQRLHMTTVVGSPEWRAYDENKNMVELSLAVELHDFTIDEYPPKVMVLDNTNGNVLPLGKPESLLLDENFEEGEILNWKVKLLEYLPMAAGVTTEDTMKFVPFHSLGATHAAKLEVENTKTREKHTGWISCGSFMFPYRAMRLDNEVSLIMPELEPKRYASEVTVFTESGKQVEAIIEVNKPLKIENWKIYQLSFDEDKGRWSEVSVFELVKDPWLPIVYFGIVMMILGAICMFAIPQKIKAENHELE